MNDTFRRETGWVAPAAYTSRVMPLRLARMMLRRLSLPQELDQAIVKIARRYPDVRESLMSPWLDHVSMFKLMVCEPGVTMHSGDGIVHEVAKMRDGRTIYLVCRYDSLQDDE